MYSLFLGDCGSMKLIGQYDEESKMFNYASAYAKEIGIDQRYTRLCTTEIAGQKMTMLDFGSWSQFFYIYPVLEWMKSP